MMNEDIFTKYGWSDGLEEARELKTKNCIGCINSIKGVCRIQGKVPEHRCEWFKKKKTI